MLRSLHMLIFIKVIAFSNEAQLADVTHALFGTKSGGVLAAFGDFNADKHTDIFLIGNDGTEVNLLQAEQNPTTGSMVFYPHNLITLSGHKNDTAITSVVPGDFNGDSRMDLLITRQLREGSTKEYVTVDVYWGEEGNKVGHPLTLEQKLVDQPLVFDWNGDMIPDLIGETQPGQRRVWLGQRKNNFTVITLRPPGGNETTLWPAFSVPHSNAFLDLNNDYTADLCLTVKDGFEIWYNVDGVLTYNYTRPLPKEEFKHIGQSVFADIDSDSNPDQILPVCLDSACAKSVIYVYIHDQWVIMANKLQDGDKLLGFMPPGSNIGKIGLHVSLHLGDYNMDGYPDALAILSSPGNGTRKAYLLQNTECSQAFCGGAGRTFRVVPDTVMEIYHNTALATFFDIYENGILDILMVSITNKEPYVLALRNSFSADACFVKVTVVSGLCYTDCPGDRPPYGVNQPGPAIKYETTKTDGKPQKSCAAQLSQSAHNALQMPYTIFGLGQMPNFVDRLSVGIPHPPNTDVRKHTWPSIIPNSQLIVIPYPNNKPNSWKFKLFVTPSRLVLLTGAALLGTCGFIAGIVGILHWREKREDKKEKRQDAHKFHFDAM